MADIDVGVVVPSPLSWQFGARYPLPFRVLFLSSSTVLGFATNLHLLSYLGIDTALVLDVRLDDYTRAGASASAATSTRTVAAPFAHPSKLYPPIYGLAAAGLLWTLIGWTVFLSVSKGEPEQMVRWRVLPAFTAVAVGVATICPWNVLYRKERMMFLRSLRRTILSSLRSSVPFCDIILADILTSSAKVLGDVWVSGCLLFTPTKSFGLDGETEDACARVFMVPIMTSLPYLFRFRQCVSEVVTGSTPTPHKSMLNALKYATAFPVIFLSAMQSVIGDPFEEQDRQEDAWISRTTLFYLWILAVAVNSLYSFWWDVTNDWGLSLLTRQGWSSSPAASYSFLPSPAAQRLHPTSSRITPSSNFPHARGRSQHLLHVPGTTPSSASNLAKVVGMDAQFPPPPSRPLSPTMEVSTPSRSAHRPQHTHHHSRAFSTAAAPNITYPFLRPVLLLPDPTIYYLAILIDLVLRFTWSLKLSSHLHSIHENESGIFLMEALEVVRRWMWVYLRLEWEAVRKGGGGSVGGPGASMMDKDDSEVVRMRHPPLVVGPTQGYSEEEIELLRRPTRREEGYRDEPVQHHHSQRQLPLEDLMADLSDDEEMGLGIVVPNPGL